MKAGEGKATDRTIQIARGNKINSKHTVQALYLRHKRNCHTTGTAALSHRREIIGMGLGRLDTTGNVRGDSERGG